MALKIRLARGGAKKRPFYRIVVAQATAPRDGRFIERLGHYNPLLPKDHADRLKVDLERVKYWLGNGAQPTERIARFLAEANLLTFERPSRPNKEKPKKKAQERQAAKQAGEAAPAAEGA